MAEKSLAIIGGGASAILLLAHLSKRADAGNFTIDVYDREGRFGKGIAYSTLQACHLLNVRAANMSALQDDKDDFASWAGGKGYAPSDFVPRRLYGQYLLEKFEFAKNALAIDCFQDDVMTAVKSPDAFFTLATTKGEKRIYKQVVLASGNVRPLHPALEGPVEGYYADPWSADFPKLLGAKTVALIGSGLSAVDMVLALEAQGYEGAITIYSRNALLPAPHAAPLAYPSFLAGLGQSPSPLRLLQALREEAATVAARGIPWQAVIDSLRPHTNLLWQGWSGAERAQFSKRLLTFWNIHRHRMAPEIAAKLEALKTAGRLNMVKANVLKITDGPVVVCKGGAYKADAVINCLGYRYAEEGRGYDVTAAIGPANFGELFETTAIPEIREQAHKTAGLLTP